MLYKVLHGEHLHKYTKLQKTKLQFISIASKRLRAHKNIQSHSLFFRNVNSRNTIRTDIFTVKRLVSLHD